MKMSSRLAILGLLSLIGMISPFQRLTAAPPVQPLDRVPADAAIFAHLTADKLWDHPAIADLRKHFAKELDGFLKTVEKETGLRPEQLSAATFYFPKFPQGNGDEQMFVLQVVTKQPYNKETLLAGLRPKGEAPKGDVAKLEGKLLLHFTSPTQFTVLHETLLDEFNKGASKVSEGIMRDAIVAAKAGKTTFVGGFDPVGLPDEIFANAPEELKPFLPLLKSKAIMLLANLDKELTAEIRFLSDKEDHAMEAERSFNLLMKLADDGITTVLKDEKPNEEVKPLLPALAELQKVVQGVKAQRTGKLTIARATIKADSVLARPLAGIFLKPMAAADRARSSNNLKQIGLALHNYHDTYGVLPAAAIVDKKGKPLLSWRVAILPFIEQDNLYKQFKLDEPWDSEHNLPLSKTIVKVYQLPYGESKPGYTHYRNFVGGGAAFDLVQGLKLSQFTDGTSNTIFAFEAAEGVPWAKPDVLEFDPTKMVRKHFRFENNSPCMILMADGSVRAIPSTIKEEILKLLIQRDDGQVIPDF